MSITCARLANPSFLQRANRSINFLDVILREIARFAFPLSQINIMQPTGDVPELGVVCEMGCAVGMQDHAAVLLHDPHAPC